MISWKAVQQQIERNLPNMKIYPAKIRNLDSNYEQTTDLKSYFENYYPEMDMNILTKQIAKEQTELATKKKPVEKSESIMSEFLHETSPKISKLDYIPGQLTNLPSQLSLCLPDFDKLYLYGVPRSDSFLMATALIVKKDFLFYDNKKQKDDYVKDKKMELAMCLRDYFNDENYRMLGAKRSDMENELIGGYEVNDVNRWYIANYHKVNIVMLNLISNTFQMASSWNDMYPVVIMIIENDVYLPILNNQGENIFLANVLKKIREQYMEQPNPLITQFNKKMTIKQKKQNKKNEKFQDLSKKIHKDHNSESDEYESQIDSETESEPDIETEFEPDIENELKTNKDEESDIELTVTYPEYSDTDSDEKNVVIKKKVSLKKSLINKENNYTKSQLQKMNLTDLKSIAKENNISLTKDSKAKKKADLLEEVLDVLF
jgi:hypothetical protein